MSVQRLAQKLPAVLSKPLGQLPPFTKMVTLRHFSAATADKWLDSSTNSSTLQLAVISGTILCCMLSLQGRLLWLDRGEIAAFAKHLCMPDSSLADKAITLESVVGSSWSLS
jgi:hypothetical protein